MRFKDVLDNVASNMRQALPRVTGEDGLGILAELREGDVDEG
jgi:hypothetical protein